MQHPFYSTSRARDISIVNNDSSQLGSLAPHLAKFRRWATTRKVSREQSGKLVFNLQLKSFMSSIKRRRRVVRRSLLSTNSYNLCSTKWKKMHQKSSIRMIQSTISQFHISLNQSLTLINQKSRARRTTWIKRACWITSRMSLSGTPTSTKKRTRLSSTTESQRNRKKKSLKTMTASTWLASKVLKHRKQKQRSNLYTNELSETWTRDSVHQWISRISP